MKKIVVLLLSIIVINSSFAQNSNIKVDFKEIDIVTAISLANEKGILVFCNFSTSWCAPCKKMLENVYTDKNVVGIMNKNFISLYIDSEAKEWIDVAKKFQIKGYPTMIILDGEGKEKGRFSGGREKNQFLAEIDIIMDDSRSPTALKRRYDSGERTPELINDYAMHIMKSGDEKKGYEIVNSYFNSLSTKKKANKENWFIYEVYSLSVDDIKCKYLIENYKGFYNSIGRDSVDKYIFNLLKSAIAGYISGYYCNEGRYDASKFNNILNMVSSLGIKQKEYLETCIRIAQAQVNSSLKEGDSYHSFIKVCEKEFDKLERIECVIMVSNFSNLTLKASDKTKVKAIKLIEKYKKKFNYQPKSIDILAKAIADLTPVKRGDVIDFKDISFDEAVEMAKKKNKLIFIDCYTDWCGPCKKLSTEVFTAKIVKNYFDKNLINLKIDMEKGEGPELSKKFKIRAFPTLLLVNGEGEVVFEKTGAPTTTEFLKIFKDANKKYNPNK